MKTKFLLIILICMITTTFTAATTVGGLEISDYNTNPSSLSPGLNDAILQMDIYHVGTVIYTEINIAAIFPEEFESVKNNIEIAKMNRLDKFTVILKFNTKEDIDTGVYSIPIEINYKDDTGQFISYKKFVNLQVSDTPVLELIDIQTETPYIGERFTTTFIIQNTELLPASNIVASIDLENEIISWIPSSKTINLISEKSISNIDFTGVVSKNTKPGSYPGTITLLYNGKTLSNKFILDVYGEPDLRIAGIATGDDVYTNQKASISFQIENVGKGDAGSLKVVLLDDFYTGVKTSYIGTVEYDDTGTAIFDLKFINPGINNIQATIFYTDKLGNEKSFNTNFNVLVNKTPEDYTLIIVFILIIVIVYFWYIKKKKNAKKLKKV